MSSTTPENQADAKKALDDAQDKAGDSEQHPVLGSSTNPESLKNPSNDSGKDSVEPSSAEAGSSTHLNAYRAEFEDKIAAAHNAVEELVEAGRALADKSQAS